jgi:hypothetical protein
MPQRGGTLTGIYPCIWLGRMLTDRRGKKKELKFKKNQKLVVEGLRLIESKSQGFWRLTYLPEF